MKKLRYLILAFIIALPFLVSATYTITLTLTESNGTNYTTPKPWVHTFNNSYMITNKYMTSTGLDTRVLDAGVAIPHLVCDDKLLYVTTLNTNTAKGLTYEFGDDLLSNFYIILGPSGYITTNDNANLEPGNNFDIVVTGYFDTTYLATPKHIVEKASSLTLQVDAASQISGTWYTGTTPASLTVSATNITSGMHTIRFRGDGTTIYIYVDDLVNPVDTETMQVTLTGQSYGMATTANGYLQQIPSVYGAATHWQAVNTQNGATSYVYYTVYGGDWNKKWDYYTLNASGIPASGVTVTGVWTTIQVLGSGQQVPGYYQSAIKLGSDIVYGLERNSTAGSWNVYSDTIARPGGGSWTREDLNNIQAGIGINAGFGEDGEGWWGATECSYVAVGVSYDYTFYAGGVNNANAWKFMDDNVMIYATSIKMSIGGVEKLWYQPNNYISTTVLPDRDATQNGAITWGANPAGITTSYGLMSYVAGTTGTSSEIVNPDIAGVTAGEDQFAGGTEGEKFLFYDIWKTWIEAYNTLGGQHLDMGWFWMVVGGVITFIATIFSLRTRSMFAMYIVGCGVLILICGSHIYDWWVFYLYVLIGLVFLAFQKVHSL